MARKSVAFKIRIEEELRRAFVAACQADDLSSAQVVRQFMRDYVAGYRPGQQGRLFESSNNNGQTG